MHNALNGIVAAAIALAVAACGNVSHDVAKDGHGAGQLVWPSTSDVTPMHKGGTFPDIANLRQVKVGLNKQQVSDLIGFPHFSEGIWGVREWNYVFNFRKPGGDEVTVCQYKVLFDDEKLARSFYWMPETCADFLKDVAPISSSAPAAVAAEGPHVLSADALFAFDSAELSLAGKDSLTEMAKSLQGQGQKLRSVRITGYTDRLGSQAYNRRLSQRRADAVKTYLVAQGLPADRVVAEGRGEADPLKGCEDAPPGRVIECLAPNRRVEVRVTSVR
ncbi:OmpA family protein [Luteibacter sp. 3190]|uniref:OmpA family protein n=1 Tax=Luteibacter sp. 3190 TaxID=2817736 RepID=UPI00285E9F97|nr:OmpA family protein [Luteibacter sp. 3190]MDR6935323.1 outer membrane protein OmpA-like peptidoglycan-associated protein [Luteibacter sp. 3190]